MWNGTYWRILLLPRPKHDRDLDRPRSLDRLAWEGAQVLQRRKRATHDLAATRLRGTRELAVRFGQPRRPALDLNPERPRCLKPTIARLAPGSPAGSIPRNSSTSGGG